MGGSNFSIAADRKFVAYYLTHSVSILTDAMESIVNVAAGFIGLYSLYVAAKPRDRDHPYGHGKAEFLSAAMPIVDIQRVKPIGDNHRYDIEVEGNHCYVVDGVVVHNSPETTSGGRALKFYATMRLDIRRIQSIKQGGDTTGNRTKVRVTKNKVAAPFREAEFDIMFFEAGISKPGEIVDLGVELGIIDKRGAFFRYNEGLLGQGREASKQFLMENPAVSDEIEDAIRAHYGLPPGVSSGK